MHEDLFFFRGNKDFFLGELVGKSYCDSSYYQARKNSDVTVIEYVESGMGTVKVNGIEYTVKAGDVYLLPLYSNHIYFSDNKKAMIKYFINVRGTLPSELLKIYKLQNRYIFKNSQTYDLFLELLKTAQSEIEESKRQELFASIVLKIIVRLHNNCIQSLNEDSDIATIKNIIDNSPGKIYTIPELSDMVHRSRDYIIKNFYNAYGMTPHCYIIQRKISTAKILLTDTKLSILEISISLGYNNVEYFSTQFKKNCGISPQQYRQIKTREKQST